MLIPSTAAATAEIKFDDLIRDLERADDSTVAYKSALEKGEDRIRQHYTGNESAWQAIVARSALVDSILIQCWSTLVGGQHFSLLAVGGYGRGELHPYSDVDLMILVDKKIESRFETAIGEFVARLWDIGLDIGHSVRTINECIVESRLDVTVITNLMESRRLAGAAALYRQMLSEIQPEKIWPADEFFRAKREEQRRRHIRFQDTSYRLEPNVKESPGGIRDIQTIRWIAQRYFNTSDFQALVEQGFLAPEELTTLRQGEDLLCKIRFLLHNTAGRREDRLLFDYQRDLAHAFGYTVDEKNHCIEQFMQGYYRTVMALERLNEMLLQLFDEGLPGKQANKPIVPLNDRFQINNQHIEVVNENVFAVHPPALLELFLLSAQNPQIDGVRANTIRLVRSHLYLIDDDFRDNPISRGLFMEILRQPQGITHQLRRMNRYGVLAAYLPTFESIVGRMQYDLFHIFTVDEHILMVIRNMRRFAIDKHRDEVPQCNYVMESIEKPELLFLMGLFHDIAKGRGGNHSELGATEAHDFCIEHGLSAVDASLVQWAVANHLIMSMTVQRRDVSDPEEIYSFAQRVSSKTHLDYLYLLTVADIRGTDPALWNSWKDSLLKTLYHGTLKVLNRGLENPLNKAEIIAENKTRALTLLTDCSVDKTEIFRHWNNLGDIYFLRYSADEISWHTAEIIKHNNDNVPLVSIRQDTRYGSTEIFIYCADQDHLFAQITTVIGRLELNIISARIMTSTTGYALDRFRVLDKSGRPVTEKTQLRQIRIDLESALCQPKLLPPIDARQQSRRLKHFHIPVSVEFDNEVTAGLTSVTVNATDISGALSLIARGFLVCDLSVHAAKVATIGEKIDDVFFISHRDNRPVTDPAQLDKLEQILIEQLSA